MGIDVCLTLVDAYSFPKWLFSMLAHEQCVTVSPYQQVYSQVCLILLILAQRI